MSNELITQTETSIAVWDNEESLKTIKELYAKDLTVSEFKIFMEMGKRLDLNPFLREIWAIKYDKSAAAQIFIGRDGYRKSISRNETYEHHFCDAVFENDEFNVNPIQGTVVHQYNLKNRGKLIGGYSCVKMKNKEKMYYVFVELSEYNTNRSVWKDKPATMIKKVAECQAIRMADSVTYSGTYSDDELPSETLNKTHATDINKKLESLNKPETIEGTVNYETGEVTTEVNEGLQAAIKGLTYFEKMNIPRARVFAYFDISSAEEITESIFNRMVDIKTAITDGQLTVDNAFSLE